MRSIILYMILTAFLTNTLMTPSYAQVMMAPPESRVALSPAFHPSVLKGVKVFANDPFRFDFIIDKGDAGTTLPAIAQHDASVRLIKYFLAALTVPEKDLWVNLSPYEKDRIVPEAFGRTGMGRDLLAQDYLLKQITSSLMYPEDGLGKKFWEEVYKQARAKFGTTDIPVDTFNKVWIVPAKAAVYERSAGAGVEHPRQAVAYVVGSRLKVMLDADRTADMRAHTGSSFQVVNADSGEIPRKILREVILPVLEKEVNEGRNFAQLRQVYNSLILAFWYKKKVMGAMKASGLGFYVGRNKISGVNIDDPKEAEKIWGQYVQAFKKGAYNYIREEYDPVAQETIPRKYFSGGVGFSDHAMEENVSFAAPVPQEEPSPSLIYQVKLIVPAGEKPERPLSQGTSLVQTASLGSLLNAPGVRLLQNLEQASYSLGRQLGALPEGAPRGMTLHYARDFLGLLRREVPLGPVTPLLQQLADKIVEPARTPLTTAAERAAWLHQVMDARAKLIGSQPTASVGANTDEMMRQLMQALGILQDEGNGERDVLKWARDYQDLMFTCGLDPEAGKKAERSVLNFEKAFIRYLEHIGKKYAESGPEREARISSGMDIRKVADILSINAPRQVKRELKGDLVLRDGWPLMLEALESLLEAHVGSMTDDSRSILLAMLLRGYAFGQSVGLKESGRSGALLAARLFLENKDVSFFQKDQLLQIIAFIGLRYLPQELYGKIVAEIAYYGQEGSLKGKKILRQYEQLTSKEGGPSLRQRTNAVWEKLQAMGTMGPDEFARVRDEVLHTPMLPENGPIEGYPSKDYGVGFEFEAATQGSYQTALRVMPDDLRLEGLGSWGVKDAGDGQIEIETPFYPNTGKQWRAFRSEVSKVLNGARSVKQITSMHINTNVNPLSTGAGKVFDYDNVRSFSRLIKVLEGVLWRTTRHKAIFEPYDFPECAEMRIPMEVLLSDTTDKIAQNRQMMNVRKGKIEGRYQLPPAYNNARQVNTDLLRQYVHIQYALVKYVAQHPGSFDILRLPLPVTLGEKRGPEYDWKLMCFMDRVLGNDAKAKAIFLKLYYHPRWGGWRTLSEEDADVLQDNVSKAYEQHGYGNIYRMHQESGGYEPDPVGFIRQKIMRARDMNDVEGWVWGLIDEVCHLGNGDDTEKIIGVLRERGWDWVSEVWRISKAEDMSDWLQASAMGKVLHDGKDIHPWSDDFIGFLLKNKPLWMNLHAYLSSFSENWLILFMGHLLQQSSSAQDIPVLLSKIYPSNKRRALVKGLALIIENDAHREETARSFPVLMDNFSDIEDSVFDIGRKSLKERVLEHLREQDLSVKIRCQRPLREIVSIREYNTDIRKMALEILHDIGALDEKKDLIPLLRGTEDTVFALAMDMLASNPGTSAEGLLTLIRLETKTNRLMSLIDRFISRGGDVQQLNLLADQLGLGSLLNEQKKFMLYMRSGRFARLLELLASYPDHFRHDPMKRMFYLRQALKATQSVPGADTLRRVVLADVAKDYPWALSFLTETPADMVIDMKQIGNSRLIHVNGKILVLDETDTVNVLDHNFNLVDSYYRDAGFGAKLFQTSKDHFFSLTHGGTLKFLGSDLKYEPPVLLKTGLGSIGKASSFLETSKGLLVGGEHGFVVLDNKLELLKAANDRVGKVSSFLETSRGILVGGERGYVVLNDDLQSTAEPVDLVKGVSGMWSTSQGIYISGKAGTRLLNADLTPATGGIFPGQYVGQVKDGAIFYLWDDRFFLIDENFKVKWSIGTTAGDVFVKGPDAVEPTFIPGGNFVSSGDLEIRPWGMVLHCTRADLFFNFRLDLLMAVPRMPNYIIAVSYQGEKMFVASNFPAGADSAESFTQDRHAVSNGGIDLTSEQMRLETTSDGAEMDFTLDPSALQRYQAAPGLEPVIINTMPLDDLQKFLAVQ